VKPIHEQLAPLSATEVVASARIQGKDFGCQWHMHPELELTLVISGGSHRWIGNQIAPLKAGDLTFLGSNLPHDFRNEPVAGKPFKKVNAVNVQFHPKFLGKHWLERAEMTPIQRLFQDASLGLEITGKTRDRVAKLMMKMLDAHGLRRLILLMEILDDLAVSQERTQISSPGFCPEIHVNDRERIGMITTFIQQKIDQPIYLSEVAKHLGMSEVTFSRYFRAHTGKTFPEYVNELRIARVCRLLAETDDTISEIAWNCGFDSMANFQKQFRRNQGYSPKAYRQKTLRQ